MNAPVISWCRHCGKPGPMTREHIPAESTGNASPVRQIVDPFDLTSVVREVAEWQDGHVVSTLDLGCNSRASNWGYVREYGRWRDLVVDHARAEVARTGADPLRGGQPVSLDLPYDVQPARFVRQVIGMFLAVQASEHLFAGYSVLPELIGPDPADTSRRRQDGIDIAPLHLYVSVCNADWRYLKGPMLAAETAVGTRSPVLWTPASTMTQTDEVFVLVLAPFAFVLTTKNATDFGHDLTGWTAWTVDQRPGKSQRRLVLPTADQLDAGLRAMIYPKDYIVRSPAEDVRR